MKSVSISVSDDVKRVNNIFFDNRVKCDVNVYGNDLHLMIRTSTIYRHQIRDIENMGYELVCAKELKMCEPGIGVLFVKELEEKEIDEEEEDEQENWDDRI